MFSKTLAKYIQSLDQKKFRDEYDVFVAESPKLVTELLQSQNYRFRLIVALPEWISENDRLMSNSSIEELIAVKSHELEMVSKLKHAHKVIAVIYKNYPKELIIENKLSLALDDIQDPGNMGTILRIADWFGIENVICSLGCVDIYNPKVVQSTMGSIARVNVVYHDLVSLIEEHPDVNVYAAMLEGKNITDNIFEQKGILLIGNEGHGINSHLVSLVKHKITIPKYGRAESLNAAIATAIILSHLVK